MYILSNLVLVRNIAENTVNLTLNNNQSIDILTNIWVKQNIFVLYSTFGWCNLHRAVHLINIEFGVEVYSNHQITRLHGGFSGPRTPPHPPRRLFFTLPLTLKPGSANAPSLDVFLTVLTSFIIVILDFILLILHQCVKKNLADRCVYSNKYVLTRSGHF